MAETKYGKYIVTEPKANIAMAPWSPPVAPGRIAYLDSDVVEGAFYMECHWIKPGMRPPPGDENAAIGVKAHAHDDWDEILGFFGTDLENPRDLGGEVEMWLGDEKHMLTKSCLVFVPKGLKHCPLIFRRVDRPIFHFTTGPKLIYGGEEK